MKNRVKGLLFKLTKRKCVHDKELMNEVKAMVKRIRQLGWEDIEIRANQEVVEYLEGLLCKIDEDLSPYKLIIDASIGETKIENGSFQSEILVSGGKGEESEGG